MAYFDCIVGGSGKGNTLVVTCVDDLAGATITCTNGTKTYTKTCPSTAPYEVTFYGLEAGTWTVSATVSGDTYTTTVVITDYEAELGGFNWKAWVDLSENYTSSDFTDLDDLLSDETAIRELMTIHACVDYLAEIAAASADVEQIIENDYCAKWINNRDYALDTLYANEIIAGYMDEADKYFYGELSLQPQVPTMTSNTTPSGEVSASSAYSANYAAWKAFDGDSNTYWDSEASANLAWIQYDFTTPICVKRMSITPHVGSYSGGKYNYCKSFRVIASYDGETWEEILPLQTLENISTTTTFDYDIDNSKVYRYYKVADIDTYLPLNEKGIETLQFYAYAPKVNVPVMTSNTAPYGTAFGSTIHSGSAFYGAFDGIIDDTSGAHKFVTDVKPGFIGYKSVNPINVKRFSFVTSSMDIPVDFKLQGSNDGSSYEDIKSYEGESLAGITEYTYDIPENAEYYLYHRLYVSTTNAAASRQNIQIVELQFYGRELWKQENSQYVPDYSEREFEEGVTKKWLYDHGVKVSGLTSHVTTNGTVTDDGETLLLKINGGSNYHAIAYSTEDLSDYSLFRVKVGKECYSSQNSSFINIGVLKEPLPSAGLTGSNLDANVAFGGSYNLGVIPNNLSVDITAFNESRMIGAFCSTAGTFNMWADVKEMWLE